MHAEDESGTESPGAHVAEGEGERPLPSELEPEARAATQASDPEPPLPGPSEPAPQAPPQALPPETELARSRRHHVAPALIDLDRVDEDATFKLRPEGDLSLLATDLARLGQLFPVELRLRPPDRFQVISGFRRVAALRFLKRDKVLARLHTDLSDGDALLMALAAAIHGSPVSGQELEDVRVRLEQEGRLDAAARDMLEKALAEDDSLAPEQVEEEVDADELATAVTAQLGEINQDLALLADVFESLDETRKEELIKQLRYSSELVAFLEGE